MPFVRLFFYNKSAEDIFLQKQVCRGHTSSHRLPTAPT
jgi:hypothetical protein